MLTLAGTSSAFSAFPIGINPPPRKSSSIPGGVTSDACVCNDDKPAGGMLNSPPIFLFILPPLALNGIICNMYSLSSSSELKILPLKKNVLSSILRGNELPLSGSPINICISPIVFFGSSSIVITFITSLLPEPKSLPEPAPGLEGNEFIIPPGPVPLSKPILPPLAKFGSSMFILLNVASAHALAASNSASVAASLAACACASAASAASIALLYLPACIPDTIPVAHDPSFNILSFLGSSARPKAN